MVVLVFSSFRKKHVSFFFLSFFAALRDHQKTLVVNRNHNRRELGNHHGATNKASRLYTVTYQKRRPQTKHSVKYKYTDNHLSPGHKPGTHAAKTAWGGGVWQYSFRKHGRHFHMTDDTDHMHVLSATRRSNTSPLRTTRHSPTICKIKNTDHSHHTATYVTTAVGLLVSQANPTSSTSSKGK